jgi:hypothetical protein
LKTFSGACAAVTISAVRKRKGRDMFDPRRYSDKAAEYSKRGLSETGSDERRRLEHLEKKFTRLAANEQWLSDRHREMVQTSQDRVPALATSPEQEEHVLRCLGAALIMQWNTLPTKLQRELFDNAGSMGELLDTGKLRGQVARFLHRHKDADSDPPEVAT